MTGGEEIFKRTFVGDVGNATVSVDNVFVVAPKQQYLELQKTLNAAKARPVRLTKKERTRERLGLATNPVQIALDNSFSTALEARRGPQHAGRAKQPGPRTNHVMSGAGGWTRGDDGYVPPIQELHPEDPAYRRARLRQQSKQFRKSMAQDVTLAAKMGNHSFKGTEPMHSVLDDMRSKQEGAPQAVHTAPSRHHAASGRPQSASSGATPHRAHSRPMSAMEGRTGGSSPTVKIDWDMPGERRPKGPLYEHGSTLHEHVKHGRFSGHGRSHVDRGAHSGHADRFGGRCDHSHGRRSHNSVNSRPQSSLGLRGQGTSDTRRSAKGTVARRVAAAEEVARKMLKAEATMRQMATNTMQRKQVITILADKNEQLPPKDWVNGEPAPSRTLYPQGSTFNEQCMRQQKIAKGNPPDQDPFVSAGGSKQGIELESWQTKTPGPDVAESHPPLVPEPKNSIPKIPSYSQFRKGGPIPKKAALHPKAYHAVNKVDRPIPKSQHMA